MAEDKCLRDCKEMFQSVAATKDTAEWLDVAFASVNATPGSQTPHHTATIIFQTEVNQLRHELQEVCFSHERVSVRPAQGVS